MKLAWQIVIGITGVAIMITLDVAYGSGAMYLAVVLMVLPWLDKMTPANLKANLKKMDDRVYWERWRS